jgi:hypothetical protein
VIEPIVLRMVLDGQLGVRLGWLEHLPDASLMHQVRISDTISIILSSAKGFFR